MHYTSEAAAAAHRHAGISTRAAGKYLKENEDEKSGGPAAFRTVFQQTAGKRENGPTAASSFLSLLAACPDG